MTKCLCWSLDICYKKNFICQCLGVELFQKKLKCLWFMYRFDRHRHFQSLCHRHIIKCLCPPLLMRHPNVWAWAGIDLSKICLYPHTLVKIQNINYQVGYTGASFLTKCMHNKMAPKNLMQ